MTSPVTLTAFQESAEPQVVRLLGRLGIAVTSREIMHGVVPFLSSEPQTVVKINTPSVVIWIDGKEASYTHGGRTERFERAGYSSSDELIDDLLSSLNATLGGQG